MSKFKTVGVNVDPLWPVSLYKEDMQTHLHREMVWRDTGRRWPSMSQDRGLEVFRKNQLSCCLDLDFCYHKLRSQFLPHQWFNLWHFAVVTLGSWNTVWFSFQSRLQPVLHPGQFRQQNSLSHSYASRVHVKVLTGLVPPESCGKRSAQASPRTLG